MVTFTSHDSLRLMTDCVCFFVSSRMKQVENLSYGRTTTEFLSLHRVLKPKIQQLIQQEKYRPFDALPMLKLNLKRLVVKEMVCRSKALISRS